MQLEHICSHLKAHSQSSPDFQEEIGMSEIGKVSMSAIIIVKFMKRIDAAHHFTKCPCFSCSQLN